MKNVYRNYYHHSDAIPTNFLKVGENKWWCTHGDWVGEVRDGDELTLHHIHGKATASHYEDYEEEVEEPAKIGVDLSWYDWEDDIAF